MQSTGFSDGLVKLGANFVRFGDVDGFVIDLSTRVDILMEARPSSRGSSLTSAMEMKTPRAARRWACEERQRQGVAR